MKNSIDVLCKYLKEQKDKKIVFFTTSNRWEGEENLPKSSILAINLSEKLSNCLIIDVSKLKIFSCEGNVSKHDGNGCGIKQALLNNKLKNPNNHIRCWASVNNETDEMYIVANAIFEADIVIFFGSIRWGKMNAVYAQIIERLTWLENRHTTLKESNLLKDKQCGVVAVGHNWNGEEAVKIEKNVLGFFGFKTPDELFFNWQFTENKLDESAKGYQEDYPKFIKSFNIIDTDEDDKLKNGGVVTYRQKYNKKYGYNENESHDLSEISKDTGVSKKGLQQIYNKGIGAYKTNPQSVRPNVKSKEQWAKARVYSAVMGGKAAKIDANELKMENGGINVFKTGGEIQEHKETYKKWKSLVNMSKTELEKFYNSQEGKDAGLSSSEANSQGISSGRESARWIMRMKDTPVSEWTPSMWRWANKQISFISRMSGNKGPLYDEKGRKTRKHTSLLIWGHNPKKYELGGGIDDINTINTIELLNHSVINDFQSGSSLDFYQDLIFVVGDDAKDLVVLYKDFTEAKRVNMFQSETARIPKDVKYDLETSTIVGVNGVNNLLILGSSAKQEFRSVGYLIPLNTKYVVPEPFRYNTFVSRLKREDGIKEINIEGCASLPNKFLLANRGNKRNPDNLLIVTENNFWENQENATISVCRMLLPDKDAAVSELNYDELTDTLFFTASIEQTTNAIDDGNIGDSFLGYIKNISQKLNQNTIKIDAFHNLSKISPKFEKHKIEGMCIESKSGNNYTINLVSDNDNEESTIFKIKLITEL